MRVVAGHLKGRRLKAPRWEGLRPTSEKLRETLFNVLAGRVVGARVLDGYAGTGALGLEAISRGASQVTFVESDRRAQALLAENVALCGVANGCAIIRSAFVPGINALRAVPTFVPYDIVLLDPPYDQQPDEMLTEAASAIAHDGVVVLEHARRQRTPERVANLVRVRQVFSGDSALSLYERLN
jgi:16S rRNA (guanine(966)-N(2))-methyltransferase RsmD